MANISLKDLWEAGVHTGEVRMFQVKNTMQTTTRLAQLDARIDWLHNAMEAQPTIAWGQAGQGKSSLVKRYIVHHLQAQAARPRRPRRRGRTHHRLSWTGPSRTKQNPTAKKPPNHQAILLHLLDRAKRERRRLQRQLWSTTAGPAGARSRSRRPRPKPRLTASTDPQEADHASPRSVHPPTRPSSRALPRL